jgi:hypothetical protein
MNYIDVMDDGRDAVIKAAADAAMDKEDIFASPSGPADEDVEPDELPF